MQAVRGPSVDADDQLVPLEVTYRNSVRERWQPGAAKAVSSEIVRILMHSHLDDR